VAGRRGSRRQHRRQTRRPHHLTTENILVTSDEDFASAARSDALLARVLGRSLGQATLRLGLIVVVACGIAGTLALLAS
jgi:hypothetical protein